MKHRNFIDQKSTNIQLKIFWSWTKVEAFKRLFSQITWPSLALVVCRLWLLVLSWFNYSCLPDPCCWRCRGKVHKIYSALSLAVKLLVKKCHKKPLMARLSVIKIPHAPPPPVFFRICMHGVYVMWVNFKPTALPVHATLKCSSSVLIKSFLWLYRFVRPAPYLPFSTTLC